MENGQGQVVEAGLFYHALMLASCGVRFWYQKTMSRGMVELVEPRWDPEFGMKEDQRQNVVMRTAK